MRTFNGVFLTKNILNWIGNVTINTNFDKIVNIVKKRPKPNKYWKTFLFWNDTKRTNVVLFLISPVHISVSQFETKFCYQIVRLLGNETLSADTQH